MTWGDPLIYDLVLNTDRISVESAAAQIRHLAERPEFQETDASRAMLADLALAAARARGAEGQRADQRSQRRHPGARTASVVLRGIVVNEEEREETVRVASRSPASARSTTSCT